MAVLLTEPIAPQGMAPEAASYISQMIAYRHQEHDKEILAEMNSREETMKGGMATLKSMTESLHSGAEEEFQKVKSEAEAFTKKMEGAEIEALARVEKFRENGNELDKKVVEGFAAIEKAITDMRAQGASQAVTGDAALARFDTLVAQAKSTHDANLREIVDKITEMERRGASQAAGGVNPMASASGGDPWFGQSLGATHRDGAAAAARGPSPSSETHARQSMGLCHRRDF